jgi:glycosyltransferase involved in cell wall biosynthesis
MKIVFLTLVKIENINERNLYSDLMRKFRDEGHEVFIVTPIERRFKQKTHLFKDNGIWILKIKIPNYQKTNIFEKGLSFLLIRYFFIRNIKKYFNQEKFDLVLYSTPPITFTNIIKYFKKRDGLKSYLLLKDIFPQNAVDLGMIRKGGLLHHYFRKQEKQLYRISDYIGCMSPANVKYLIQHNPETEISKIEVNPNSIEPVKQLLSNEEKINIRKKYNIPLTSTVFIYGGNLGKPQGIDFLREVLDSNKENKEIFFVIVGDGTEFYRIQFWYNKNIPSNVLLLKMLPKAEYDLLLKSCDVGLIFLDKRFTIPNFPSRILSYMENKMPVLAATDSNTDLGEIIEKNNFGYWCESERAEDFNHLIKKLNTQVDNNQIGENAYLYLLNHFTVMNSYSIILRHFN